jgi:hypothetical protein
MQLLTKAIRRQLPPLYANEDKGLEALAIVKFFTPDSSWTWYASEFDGEDVFFGLAVSLEPELGYFRLSELQNVRGRLHLPVERDRFFTSTPLRELLDQHKHMNIPPIPFDAWRTRHLPELIQDYRHYVAKALDDAGFDIRYIEEFDAWAQAKYEILHRDADETDRVTDTLANPF